MSEARNLKYDPDDFDPIVVNDIKSIWSLVVPLALIAVSTYLYCSLTIFSEYRQAMKPGNWVGSVSFFSGFYQLIFVVFAVPIALGHVLIARRFVLALGMTIWCAAILLFGSVLLLPNPAGVRYTAELPAYEKAVATGKAFGDQYTEESDGRKLTYWRWIQFNLDNAFGVIYDPEDRLTNEQRGDSLAGDAMAFRDQAHGAMFRITKIKPRWYFVEHS